MTIAKRFFARFRGLDRAYGSYTINSGQPTKEKVDGRARTIQSEVTETLWEWHLEGRTGIGIVPITDDGVVYFGSIDIDVYDLDLIALEKQIQKLKLPLIVLRTKSGGAHCTLFGKEALDAKLIRKKLSEMAVALGYPGVEVFPKQTRLASKTDVGNWINMPYFEAAKTNRYALKNGKPLTAEQFLDYTDEMAVTGQQLIDTKVTFDDPLSDAPPCLQVILKNGIQQGMRNEMLFNLAVYARMRFNVEWETALNRFNQEFVSPPVDFREISIIAKQVDKKDYFYRCNQPPLVSHCNKELCQKTPYGISCDTNGLGKGTAWVKVISDMILETNHFAQDAGAKLYYFSDGYYKSGGDKWVAKEVKRILLELNHPQKWSSNRAKEVAEFIRIDASLLWQRPPLDCINVSNGLLHLKNGLLPHTPDFLSTTQLPVKFDSKATCPCWDEFISEVFPADNQSIAFELIAWLMFPDTSLQKAVLTTGEGANGKSTYLEAVTRLLGHTNITNVSLHQLEADRFSVTRLIGKLANICPDLPSGDLASTSMFKAITGGDRIMAEYKYHDAFEILPYARLIFSANHPPQSKDASHAFFRRWLVIPFNRTFDEQEALPRRVIDARLSNPSELSGVLNKALAVLQKLRKHGFTSSKSMDDALSDFKQVTDPLTVWIECNTIIDPESQIAIKTLLSTYNKHCKENGQPVMTGNSFGRAMRRLLPNIKKKQRTVGGKARVDCYVGIGLKGYDHEQI